MNKTIEAIRRLHPGEEVYAYDGQSDEMAWAEITTSDLHELADKIEALQTTLKQIHETIDYADRHANGLFGFTKYAEGMCKVWALTRNALDETVK